MSRITADKAGGVNVMAFLDMLAYSEIGPGLIKVSDDGYNVLVGSTTSKPLLFTSYATHPNVFNRKCNSTAAGRYQVLARYWPHYRDLLKLPDFGPVSQDRYAIQQLVECHALSLIGQGRFADAVANVAHIWASLPGAGYQQHENHMDDLQAIYVKAGGTVA